MTSANDDAFSYPEGPQGLCGCLCPSAVDGGDNGSKVAPPPLILSHQPRGPGVHGKKHHVEERAAVSGGASASDSCPHWRLL